MYVLCYVVECYRKQIVYRVQENRIKSFLNQSINQNYKKALLTELLLQEKPEVSHWLNGCATKSGIIPIGCQLREKTEKCPMATTQLQDSEDSDWLKSPDKMYKNAVYLRVQCLLDIKVMHTLCMYRMSCCEQCRI
jgi:hypothetical protein